MDTLNFDQAVYQYLHLNPALWKEELAQLLPNPLTGIASHPYGKQYARIRSEYQQQLREQYPFEENPGESFDHMLARRNKYSQNIDYLSEFRALVDIADQLENEEFAKPASGTKRAAYESKQGKRASQKPKAGSKKASVKNRKASTKGSVRGRKTSVKSRKPSVKTKKSSVKRRSTKSSGKS